MFETAQTVIVKVGTNVLSRDDDSIDESAFGRLASQMTRVRATGRNVALVSSGAIGAGLEPLGLAQRPTDLPALQAAAAAGQARMMAMYANAFATRDVPVAQLLLTADDFADRRRYLNIRHTLLSLFSYGVVPIVNENDTVSVEEIKFGDNDRLAALLANLVAAPLLVVLSIVDGLYDRDPADPTAEHVRLVERWDDGLFDLVAATKSSRGTGGMGSKLRAIKAAAAVGEPVILADGRSPDVLDRVIAGEEVGTLFLAEGGQVPAWKRWVGYASRPAGIVRVDAGAAEAVRGAGRSLLAAGVTGVEGAFGAGDTVAIVGPDGAEVGRGLANYAAADLTKIAGLRGAEIEATLGSVPYSSVVHRDNLLPTG
ncbi:MAG: glutamate 5-kinase [Planctomycetota bacterium]